MSRESKIVGIMQPYFFPYFEQFRLIAACDLWVVFDTPQFSRKSWINRNRILNREKGWTYISVPIQHTGLQTAIKNTLIDSRQDWRTQIINKLKIYQSKAPYYSIVREMIGDTLAPDYETISTLNTAILRMVCTYLKIATPILVASTLPLDLPDHCAPGEWALHIAKNFGASEYRNAAGGVDLFDKDLYASNGMLLSFHEHCPRNYYTGNFTFIEDLSVIDWMMWNDLEILQNWLD